MTAAMNDPNEYVAVRSPTCSRVDVTVRSRCRHAPVSTLRVFLTLARLVRIGGSRQSKDHQNGEKDQRKPSHSYPFSSSPLRREAALVPEAIEHRTPQQEKSRLSSLMCGLEPRDGRTDERPAHIGTCALAEGAHIAGYALPDVATPNE